MDSYEFKITDLFFYDQSYLQLKYHSTENIFCLHISKVGELSWGWPEGSLFNSYYTEI